MKSFALVALLLLGVVNADVAEYDYEWEFDGNLFTTPVSCGEGKTCEISGNLNPGTGCSIKYKQPPFNVDCALKVGLEFKINDADPIKFEVIGKAGAGISIEDLAGDTSQPVLSAYYGVTIPEVNLLVHKFPAQSFPADNTLFEAHLPASRFARDGGMCLKDLSGIATELGLGQSVSDGISTVVAAGKKVGINACVKMWGTKLASDGASVGLIFSYDFLNPNIVPEENKAALQQIRTFLNLSGEIGIAEEINIGAMAMKFFKKAVTKDGRRRLQESRAFVSETGEFRFGEAAGGIDAGSLPSVSGPVMLAAAVGGVAVAMNN